MYARSQIFVFQSSFREFVPTNNRKTSLKKKKRAPLTKGTKTGVNLL